MPYRYCTISSALPLPEAVARLRKLIEPKRTFMEALEAGLSPRPKDAPPFRGYLKNNTLRVSRAISYGNSFLPVVLGRLCTSPHGGTTIKLQLFVHPAVVVFMLLWFGGVVGSLVSTVSAAFPTEGGVDGVAVGMLIVGAGLVVVGFYPEAIKAEKLIRNAVA
jgi:hypothetical protein